MGGGTLRPHIRFTSLSNRHQVIRYCDIRYFVAIIQDQTLRLSRRSTCSRGHTCMEIMIRRVLPMQVLGNVGILQGRKSRVVPETLGSISPLAFNGASSETLFSCLLAMLSLTDFYDISSSSLPWDSIIAYYYKLVTTYTTTCVACSFLLKKSPTARFYLV